MLRDKRGNDRAQTILRFGIAAVILLFVCVGMKQSVAAEDVLLKTSRVTLFAGDRAVLQDYVNEEYQENAVYQWSGEEPDSSLAVMTEEGTVLTKAPGEVKITVSWQGEQEEEKKEETLHLTMIAPEELSMEYGSKMNLEAADLYKDDKISYSASVDSVEISAQGVLTACGFQETQITATREDETSFVVANVKILEPKLARDHIVRAVGTKGYQVELQYFSISDSSESIRWNIADSQIASWDGVGLSAIKKGSTTADIILTAKNGDQKTLKIQIVITDPTLSTTSVIMAVGTSKKITVAGTDTSSEIIWGNHAGSHAYFSSNGVIYGSSAGSVTLKVTVDGKELTCKVQVTNPGYKDLTIIMYKGQSSKLKITGTVKGSAVTYTSSNTKTLTITKTGQMKAKKTGHATVKVKADGKTISILAEISSKKGYRAMKKAIAISKTKTTYSQARRMSKGYYDCSS
ncbi:MAG: Ig-like domain-containing protein, partial [Lachnospiraceae bacterium]|nr:Ig-like domain-containing protein [Lachnospiraceae bacterium]